MRTMRPGECDRSHLQISLCRWLDLLVAAVVAAAVIFLCLVWQLERVLRVTPTAMYTATSAGLLGFVWWIGKTWKTTLQRLRHFSQYPPLWAAGFLGAGLLLLALGSCSQLRSELSIPDDIAMGLRLRGIILTTIILATFLVSWISLRGELMPDTNKSQSKSGAEPRGIEELTFEMIVQWLKNDDPIVNPGSDLFDRQEMAERIAARLCKPLPPAQAIVG